MYYDVPYVMTGKPMLAGLVFEAAMTLNARPVHLEEDQVLAPVVPVKMLIDITIGDVRDTSPENW